MDIRLVVLWTDALIYLLLFAAFIGLLVARRSYPLRQAAKRVVNNRLGLVSALILLVYLSVGVLDSIHYQRAIPSVDGSPKHYSPEIHSVLDTLFSSLATTTEKSYSAPFALTLFNSKVRGADERLNYVAADINQQNQGSIVATIVIKGLVQAEIFISLLTLALAFLRRKNGRFITDIKKILTFSSKDPTWLSWLTLSILIIFITVMLNLASQFHIFGTDKVGQDVFYLTVKSIRTGLVIGLLTTLIMLPFALLLGISAGFFGGRVDDVIQYLYITLSSIPGVLLIAASILSLQIFIANHAEWFTNLAQRADARLLALCVILGLTSWTSLCRLLRAETLKLREIDFVQASIALGSSRFTVLRRHLLPNVMHLVIIAVVLDFSALVLAEAVLSYVGVGVSPITISWGNMINSARLELAREPVVWWPILAAFLFMFIMVLAANLFSDAVRDAFDPRLKR